MIHNFFRRFFSDHDDEEQKLLQELLQTPLSKDTEGPRPVALRSSAEQRRLAFKSFLQRTWVDYTLHRLERILVLIVFIFFSIWFINGYGRDWLYEQTDFCRHYYTICTTYLGYHAPHPTTHETYAMAEHAQQGTQQQPSIATPLPVLPFTNPDMQRSTTVPDYLVPQHVVLSPEPEDQRPHRLQIPALEVDVPVKEVFVHNGVWQVADYAAGYHHGSALPGDTGNTVMAGHAGLRGAVFRDLGKLREGNMIFVDAGEWSFHYQVRQVTRVWPTQVEVMEPTAQPILTLITCTDWDTKRLVVVADLVGSYPL